MVQIRKNIDPKILFKNYKHISSGSKLNIKHLDSISKIGLKLNNSRILEIGSNDNSFLRSLKKNRTILCGVDPSIKRNIKGKNVHLYKEFFNFELSNKLKDKFKNFNFIFAINVIPHVKNLKQVIKGISNVLHPSGIFMMEGVYLLNNIQKGYFDTFYHEHVSTFSLISLNKLFDRYNLKIVKVELLNTQGGSFRVFASHKNLKYKVNEKTKNLLKKEFTIGLNKKKYYRELSEILKLRINNLKNQINKKITKIKTYKNKIIGLGAPARGVVIINVLRMVNLLTTVDDSSTKQYFFDTNSKVIN